MSTLCIYGCGGIGREIADIAFRIDKWDSIIFVDDNIKNRVVDEVSVYTFEETINEFDKAELDFIVATGEPISRQLLYKKLESHSLKYITFIDPAFRLSKLSSIKNGSIVHTGAILTVNVHIGKGCLVNKHVVIGHDVIVGDYTVISPNASIGGDVNIGPNCYLGSGSIIRNGISIGENSIIGMGSVVLQDVKPNSVVAGNPAKFLRFNEDKKVFRK